MQTPNKSFYRIREVSANLGVPTSTLRYWEGEFPMLKPQRTDSGQRRYSPEDYKLCERIRELLHDKGMKIEAVKAHLEATYRKYEPRNPFKCKTDKDAVRLLGEVKNFILDKHGIARIEAVERWITNRDCKSTKKKSSQPS